MCTTNASLTVFCLVRSAVNYRTSSLEVSKEEIRHILHFYYLKGKNASKATKKICDVYGADTLSVRVAQQWFERFRSGVVEVNDAGLPL